MKCKLGDFAEFNPKERLPKGTVAKKISMDILQPFCRDIPTFTMEEYNGGAKFRNGDTIMARITPCLENGKIAKINVLQDGEVGFGSTEYIVFRAKTEVSNPDYLYYLICSPYVRESAIKSMVGSSGRQRVQMSVLEQLEIDVPPLDMQKRIGGVLKSLDDKIQLNNSINNNLEQQAVTLFRAWFSNFVCNKTVLVQSPLGNIPSDFKVIKTGELDMLVTDYVANGSFASLKENIILYHEKNYAYFIRNTDLKAGNFEVFVDKHSYDFLSKSALFGGEIIISNVGDVGSVFLCPILDQPMTLGNNIIMLRPKQEEMKYYLYVWFKWLQGQSLIQGIKGGSAQPKFNKTDFKNLPLLVPSQEMVLKYYQSVSPMFELISSNNQENIRLSKLRDSLLSRLMSGELDVSDIDL